MVGLYTKFKATSWKCFRLRRHHYILTLAVIVLPIVLFALCSYVRSKVGGMGKVMHNETVYNMDITEDMFFANHHGINHGSVQLLYAPNDNEFINTLMDKVLLKLNLLGQDLKGFSNENELLAYYTNTSDYLSGRSADPENLNNPNDENAKTSTFAAIFDGANKTVDQLSYRLRNYEKFVYWSTSELFAESTTYNQGAGSEMYLMHGFLAVQWAIDRCFLDLKAGRKLDIVEVSIQEFPYPPHLEDMGVNVFFKHILPLITLISFILTCPSTMSRIVEEKESGIKELAKMMGLSPGMMWLCWFIDALCLNTISICFITYSMKWDWGADYSTIEHCNWLIFQLFLMLYCAACIGMCFFISTYAIPPNFITLIGVFVWIITYLIPYGLNNWISVGHSKFSILLCFVPNVAMYFGYKQLFSYEVRGIGLNFNNLFTSASGDENEVTMGGVFLMLCFDTLVFILLAYYRDSLYPGKYGLPKPWNFLIKSFMQCALFKTRTEPHDPLILHNENQHVKIEMTNNLEPGIEIKKLTKTYGSMTAVNNLTVDFYKGQITALLGHNGAGKTTTMSIMTGMVKATAGTVCIGGYDIRDHLDYIRTIIGICPQHDLVFTGLTVWENLMYFAKLNGISEPETQITKVLTQFKINDKKDFFPNKLSGGMLRKLCLSIAIITDPKVLILDEPTSGLDPKSRRELWDVLLTWRKSQDNRDRTILISTHCMEEADVLGDRIAIMDHGNLFCYGTPMYLRSQYGTDYLLTITKQTDDLNLDRDIIGKIKEDIKDAIGTNSDGTNLTIALPIREKEKFPRLFKSLEEAKNELQIESYGLAVTTIEDVFLKVSKLASESPSSRTQDQVDAIDNIVMRRLSIDSGSNSLNDGCRPYKFNDRFNILLRNHVVTFKAEWRTYVTYVAVALLVIALNALLSMPGELNFIKSVPHFDFTLQNYGKTTVFYSANKNNPDVAKFVARFEASVIAQQGIPVHVDSVSGALIKMGLNNIEDYKKHAVVAAEFNQTETGVLINAMYSNVALHGAPISLNLIMNTIAGTVLGDDVQISTSNVPLGRPNGGTASRSLNQQEVSILWVMLFPIALIFVLACFIIHPHRERQTNLKHLLFMAKIKNYCYWMSLYTFDLGFYLIVLFFIVLLSFTINSMLRDLNALGALSMILISYGIPAIPFAYLFSYKKSVASALGSLNTVNLFTGLICTVVTIILQLSGEEYYENLGHAFHFIFLVSPQYFLTYRMAYFTKQAVWNYNWENMDVLKKAALCRFNQNPCCAGINSKETCEEYKAFLKSDASWFYLLTYSMIALVFYLAILFFLDSYYFQYLFDKYYEYSWEHIKFNNAESQENVSMEKLFKAKRLSKNYRGQKVVNNLTFNIRKGDCFGILGVNGAGKTTMFKMITGSVLPTMGTAQVGEFDLQDARDDYLSMIGYCPQYNCINEILSARQLLTLFAQLRGIPYRNVPEVVAYWINRLGLEEYADIECGKYSGGNKRKLSMGISLIGDPKITMLDEPTSGVDPRSRRYLWEIIEELKTKKTGTIILTSHSMDECETLCNELLIIKNGTSLTNDTIPRLKAKYGKGFTVLLKIRKNNDFVDGNTYADDMALVDSIEDHFKRTFTEADLKDKHMSLLHFFVKSDKSLSEIYNQIHTFVADNGNVEDYTITTATLEDIFLAISND